MSYDQHNFDAPELKAAFRQAMPPVAAPAELRGRISQRLASESGDGPIPLTQPAQPERFAWLHSGRKLALAASIGGLVLGAGLYFATNQPTGPSNGIVASATPAYIDSALSHHNELEFSLARGTPLQQTLRPYAQVNRDVSEQMGLSMPNPDLSQLGWTLIGGKTCREGHCCVAQLFYQRGDDTLSVFVVPPQRVGEARQAMECSKRGAHVVAARPLGRGMLCVVARDPSGEIDPREIDAIADRLARR